MASPENDAAGQYAPSQADPKASGVASAKPTVITGLDDATAHRDPAGKKPKKDFDRNYTMPARMTALIALSLLSTICALETPAIAQDNPNQAFAQNAATMNRFEIESAKLALDLGKDARAKEYAQDMIEDHSKSLVELGEAASAERVPLPRELDPESSKKLQALREAPAADFDQAYLSTQLVVHETAVQLFMAYSKDGPDGALKNYAAHTVGTLRMHDIRIHGLTDK